MLPGAIDPDPDGDASDDWNGDGPANQAEHAQSIPDASVLIALGCHLACFFLGHIGAEIVLILRLGHTIGPLGAFVEIHKATDQACFQSGRGGTRLSLTFIEQLKILFDDVFQTSQVCVARSATCGHKHFGSAFD